MRIEGVLRTMGFTKLVPGARPTITSLACQPTGVYDDLRADTCAAINGDTSYLRATVLICER